jgi:hypothetical protein
VLPGQALDLSTLRPDTAAMLLDGLACVAACRVVPSATDLQGWAGPGHLCATAARSIAAADAAQQEAGRFLGEAELEAQQAQAQDDWEQEWGEEFEGDAEELDEDEDEDEEVDGMADEGGDPGYPGDGEQQGGLGWVDQYEEEQEQGLAVPAPPGNPH